MTKFTNNNIWLASYSLMTKGTGTFYLRVTVTGDRFEISTQRYTVAKTILAVHRNSMESV